MSSKKIKVGLAITLSSVAAAQGCGSQTTQNNPTSSSTQRKTSDVNMDSIKLEKRLLELAKTEYKGELSMGAMCYEIAAPTYVDYTCSYCGTITSSKYDDWTINQLNEIKSIVEQIEDKGYDVVLDQTEYCEHCSKELVANPSPVFKIRFSDKAGYHEVKSNIVHEYQCLLEFILGNEKFADTYGNELTLHDNIHIIQKMTGLGKNISAK